ncbi:hypothetical protein C8R43DRAFT_965550 [Mycena crocata]|nr:hypothetical protein C8R43DRAFT_965550 [Mycena crocata]
MTQLDNSPYEDGRTYPLYDLDEIIAGLTLEETLPPTSQQAKRRKIPCKTPKIPPPTICPPAPTTSQAVYTFTSLTESGQTEEWSRAASATQGQPHAHVHASPSKAKPKHPKRVAHVVYRGRNTGVLLHWPEVVASVTGVRFALHQGYASVAAATAAFNFAHEKGWTCVCTDTTWSSFPISITQAPLPFAAADDRSRSSDSTTLCPRRAGDPWYVVYAGINPGVFPTSLECALNVLGVKNSAHERVDAGYFEAERKFCDARERGDVSIRRIRTV